MDSLRERHDFISLRDKGVKQVTRYFILQARNTTHDAPPQYGLTASKKIGNAVVRNRARRRLRALVRLHLTEKARVGWHYGLIARYPLPEAPFQELETAFCKAISLIHDTKPSTPYKPLKKNGKKGR